MDSFIADLHIHSPFSRATSKKSDLPGLFSWARVKGINLVGTGDFTHPGWFSHLRENLMPAEPGFFRLKNENVPPAFEEASPEAIEVRFILTAEISSIYKRGGKVRKVHNILLVPGFESVERINRRLAALGNIESDGRPIIGLDSRDLLEILLEEEPEGFLVPAHIWTPWFSLFGSKSGFDTIEECFGDLTDHIFALETGLSSDPAMNRFISALDNYTLISNSDCHSPAKLGREVNLFSSSFDFFSMRNAIKDPSQGFDGTVEFFPEEGKYHLDGHRKCGISFDPLETKAANNICPICGGQLTVGVNHRIMDLADRKAALFPEKDPSYSSLIPLAEVISEIIGIGPNSKGVLKHYQRLINNYGSEFNILLNTPPEELGAGLPLLDEAVRRIRNNQVICKAGFDGQFGVISAFEKEELKKLKGQSTLFQHNSTPVKKKKKIKKANYQPALSSQDLDFSYSTKGFRNNENQEKAIRSSNPRILVTAGPGTGKTFTLISRLIHLIEDRKIPPDEIVAITFTNRAAGEIRERLQKNAGNKGERVTVSTFHTFCLDWLRKEKDITIIGEEEREILLRKLAPDISAKDRRKTGQKIADSFALTENEAEVPLDKKFLSLKQKYKELLDLFGAIELEEIIPTFINYYKESKEFRDQVSTAVKYFLVDEFQDVNRPQYELTELIARQSEIFAIGDPDQAIYGFRGSDLNYFFRFGREPSTEVLELKENYRSAPPILSAASQLIQNNRLKSGVKLIPNCTGKNILNLYKAPTPQAEAEYLVEKIEGLIGGISSYSINTGRSGKGESTFSFRDIAILYRLSRQAEPLVKALERRGLPFQLIGAKPFFKQADIRGIYYWLICAAGIADRGQYLALCREMPGLGKSTLDKLEETLPFEVNDFFAEVARVNLQPRTRAIINKLAEQLNIFRKNYRLNPDSSLEKAFKVLKIDINTTNAVRLKKLSAALGSLEAITNHLRENSQATVYDEKAEALSLMTLHSAKGLEFSVVFIVGCEEGYLPHLIKGCDLEEERRLFYVGLTRAREELFLSSSSDRQPSRFIKELPNDLLKETYWRNKKTVKGSNSKQLNLF